MVAEVSLTWPKTAVDIGIVLLLGLMGHVIVAVVTSGMARLARRRAEEHADERPTRTNRLLTRAGLSTERHTQRARTLGQLVRNVGIVIVWTVALLMVLSILDLPLAPLLTSAGVGGVALAFGAQSLIKDVLSGVFIILEDQYGVGDHVDIGDITGTVEQVTLRSTRLRDWSGKVWYVRNGEVLTVGNHSQGWTTTMVDLPVHYATDPDVVLPLLEEVCAGLAADEKWDDVLLAEPDVLGVESVDRGVMTLRVALKCAPNQHWAVTRALREEAKEAFDENGIEGPAGLGV